MGEACDTIVGMEQYKQPQYSYLLYLILTVSFYTFLRLKLKIAYLSIENLNF